MTIDDRVAEIISVLDGNHPGDTFRKTKISPLQSNDVRRVVEPRDGPLNSSAIAVSIFMTAIACVFSKFILSRAVATKSRKHKPSVDNSPHKSEETVPKPKDEPIPEMKGGNCMPLLVPDDSQRITTLRTDNTALARPCDGISLDRLHRLDSKSIVQGCTEEIIQQVQVASHYQREFPDLSRAEIVGLAERTVARTADRNLSMLQLKLNGAYKSAKVNQTERHHQEAMAVTEQCRDYVDHLRSVRRDVFWGCASACAAHIFLRSAPSLIEFGMSLEELIDRRVIFQRICPTQGTSHSSGGVSLENWSSVFGLVTQGVVLGESMLSCSLNVILLLIGGTIASGIALYFPRAFLAAVLLSICILVVQWSTIIYGGVGFALLYGVVSVVYLDASLHRFHRKGSATYQEVNDVKVWSHRFHWILGIAVLCSFAWNELRSARIESLIMAFRPG